MRMIRALIAITLLLVVATAVYAQSPGRARDVDDKTPKTVVGAWFVNVSPETQPQFVGLITFSADGGVAETNSLTLASSLESPGHGQWVQTGHHRFALTFVNLEVDANGNFAGTARVRSTLTLRATGDEWSGPFQVDVFDPTGVLLFSDSGTVSATRIKVEPLP